MARRMKDSGIEWIGEIPEGWSVNTVFQLFTQVKNKNSDLREQNLLSLSYGTIKRKSIDTTDGLLPASFDGYNIIEENDIVLRLTDLQNDHKSLRVGIATERGIITSAYLTIRNRSTSSAKYLYYYLHSFDIAKGFYGMGAGVRQGLNWDGIKWLKILSPSVSDQHRIAAYLDTQCAKIDAVLEQTRNSIEEYKKLKQAVITQAVTKGIRPGRKMKDSGIEWIGEVPEEWTVTKLKHFSSIRSGITLGKIYPAGTKLVELPYLRVANVQGSYTDLSDVATIRVTEEEAKKYRLKDGELLMTEGGDRDKLGRGTVWHAEIDPCLHQNHVFALRTDSTRLLADYVSYITESCVGRDYFDVTANQSVHLASTNSTTILNFTLPVPSVEEQREIVHYLNIKITMVNRLIKKKQEILDELDCYKKSLIYECVTGKRELLALSQEAILISGIDLKAILAMRIIEMMGKDLKGRIHLQKALYIFECMTGIGFNSVYVREKHGPMDRELALIEKLMLQKRWCRVIPRSPYQYVKLEGFKSYRTEYEKHFSDYNQTLIQIVEFIRKMKTSQAERVATLMAAWNDFLVEGKTNPSDHEIIEEIRTNWHERKAHTPESTWQGTLDKMKRNGIVPHGYGKHTIMP